MSGAARRGWTTGLVAVAAIVAVLGALGTHLWQGGSNGNQAAQLTAQAAAQRATTAEAALKRELQAQELADSLAVRLAQTEADLATTAKERDEALSKATTGRVCLGGAALRVLNGAPGIRVAAVPAPAAGAAAAHGPAAPDTGQQPSVSGAGTPGGSVTGSAIATDDDAGLATTDTQLSRWVVAAGAQYETCRARLDALIDYTPGVPPAPVDAAP
jgi:hypothetical protein